MQYSNHPNPMGGSHPVSKRAPDHPLPHAPKTSDPGLVDLMLADREYIDRQRHLIYKE